MQSDNRPLSPHLQVYRWQWTMAYSILHRGTGIALSGGAIFLTWWLVALATSADQFDIAQAFFGSWIGRLFLLGWAFSLFYHMANGIRHLAWDTGWGFDLKTAEWSGHIGLAVAVLLTVVTAFVAYASMG